MNADQVRNIIDLLRYLDEHKASIFVRAQLAAAAPFENVAIAALPGDLAITWTCFFVKQFLEHGFIPHRVLRAGQA